MKKVLKCLIETLLSFLSVLIYTKLIYNSNSYNFFVTLLFFMLFYFFYKYDINLNKKQRKYTIITSVIISLLLSVGSTVSLYTNSITTNTTNLSH